MREIKFRAWDKEDNSMMSVEQTMGNIDIVLAPDTNFVPLQYTGLKDKNGKEIYEGDIVRDTREWARGKIGEIRFGEGEEGEPADYIGNYIGWCLGNEDEETTGFTQYKISCYEVIGNIYENPDLVRQEGP